MRQESYPVPDVFWGYHGVHLMHIGVTTRANTPARTSTTTRGTTTPNNTSSTTVLPERFVYHQRSQLLL
jgi:hypothetical protein